MDGSTSRKSFPRREFLNLTGSIALGPVAAATNICSAPEKKFRVVDTHFHLFNSDLQGKNGIPTYMPRSTVEFWLDLMDRGGVDRAFLISYNAEDIASEIRSRGESPVVMLPVINRKYQIAAWTAHRDRFWWFPDHIDPLDEAIIDNLERYCDMGASGFKLLPLFHGLLPDHPGFRPVYELCRRRKRPIILDVSWWYLGGKIGYGYNETKTRQKMVQAWTSYADYVKILDPLFSEFSTVPFSLAHCGAAKTKEDYEHIFALIARHPNLSCDLAAIIEYSPEFIRALVKSVSARKVMYGTDAPYWGSTPDRYRNGPRRWTLISDECPFLDDEKQMILAGNAERFVKNQLPALK